MVSGEINACTCLFYHPYTGYSQLQHPYLNRHFYPGPQVLPEMAPEALSGANASAHFDVEYRRGLDWNISTKSSILFAVLFDPYNNSKEAMKGYEFHKVSDLFQLPDLPLILSARKSYYGSSSEYNSVSANELLIVRRVENKLVGRQLLKVYSHTQKKEKTLHSNCVGNFSTKPCYTALHLSDIIKHMPDIFPCRAVMLNPEAQGKARIVTLTHSSIDTAIIPSDDPNLVENRGSSIERSLESEQGDVSPLSACYRPPLTSSNKVRREYCSPLFS